MVSEPRETHSPMLKARFLHLTNLVAQPGIEPPTSCLPGQRVTTRPRLSKCAVVWQHIRVKKRPYCRREGSWRASDKGEGSQRPPGGHQGEGSRRASDGGEGFRRAAGEGSRRASGGITKSPKLEI